MAMVVNGCSLPWNPIVAFPEEGETLLELMEARFESASGVVERLEADERSSEELLREHILKLLAHDKM
jgi:hypothetical protein